MKFGLTMTRSLLVLLLAIFCFGCAFSGVDNETIIQTVVEQQFYYKNSAAEKLAESIILSSDAPMTQGYPPYFAGKACIVSSKKLLYANIKRDLLLLTIEGYFDYDNLKSISRKLADLQEKTTYDLKKVENTEEYYRKKDYEAYSLTITHPNIAELGNRIAIGIFNDLETMHKVNWRNVQQKGDVSPNDVEKLFPNLHALAQVTQDSAEMKKYGTIILKNFVNAIDDPNLNFTTEQIMVYMKDTGEERKDLERYTMPDRTGTNFVYMSQLMWRELRNQWGTNRIDQGSLFVMRHTEIDDLLQYPLLSFFKNNAELQKKCEQIFVRRNDALTKLKEYSKKITDNNDIPDLQSLEKTLDEKEQLDEELIPEICATVQSTLSAKENQLNQSALPSTSTPIMTPSQSTPTQPAMESTSSNWLNNTEVGIAFSNYYRAINEKRFSDAYSCLTEACRSRQGSLEEFATGRKDTLSVEIQYFEPVATSNKEITANYKIRTRDKVTDGVSVQFFAGQVTMIKIDNKWLIDNLASRLLKNHLE